MADIHFRCDDEMSYLFGKKCNEIGIDKSEYLRNCIGNLLNIDFADSDLIELKKKSIEIKERADGYRKQMDKEMAQYQLIMSCIDKKQNAVNKVSKEEEEEVEAAAEFMKREGLSNGLY